MRRHIFPGWLLVLLALFNHASAYTFITQDNLPITWPPGNVPMLIQLGSATTLADGTNYNTSVLAAVTTWNSLINTVQLVPQLSNPASHSTTNGVNEIDFDSTIDGDAFGSGVLAVMVSNSDDTPRPDGSHAITEADIVFNTAYQWDSYRGPLRSKQDIRRVALHELGHVLGLDHPDQATPPQEISAIMNSVISDLDRLTSDDVAGAQSLYGVSSTLVRPANDDFANAATLTLVNNTAQALGSNLWATKQPGEPNHAPNEPGGASVWWKFTPASSGSVIATTAGSDYDTMLAAYTGTAVNQLTQLAGNDDESSSPHIISSRISFNVTGGVTYSLAVDGWDGEYGSITLNLTLTASGAPGITTQPGSQTILIGGSATFAVVATGTGPLSYQWRKNAVNIPGANASSYSVVNATPADSGGYDVVVSNVSGAVTSNLATLTVSSQLAQTITFAGPGNIPFTSSPIALGATADSGLPVSFSVVSGPATVSGSSLTLTGTGLVTVRASQAGNASYFAALDVDRTFFVSIAAQTITFAGLASTPFTTSAIPLSASASSGLAVMFSVISGPATVSGSSLTLTGAGTVTVRASQAGNANYLAAPVVDRTFTVSANYLSWQQSKFTAGELANPSVSGPNAVYGLDGLTNLVKYALGLDPKVDATSGLPVTSTTSTDWVYTYTRPSNLTDITYSVEVSTDLTTWTTVDVTHELVSSSGGTDTWRARYPLTSAPDSVYFRLKVVRP